MTNCENWITFTWRLKIKARDRRTVETYKNKTKRDSFNVVFTKEEVENQNQSDVISSWLYYVFSGLEKKISFLNP